jgi:hypothetical protein
MSTPEQIRLTSDQQALVAQLAEQLGKPWSQVLSEALTAYSTAPVNGSNAGSASQAQHESFFAAASRLGLIGCVEGGPPDLSTNPKYMEGFGGSS